MKFNKLDISPMPFNMLRKIDIDIDIEITAQFGAEIDVNVIMEKANFGNRFRWQVIHCKKNSIYLTVQ